LILDNRNNASYIAEIEVEVVISYTTPLDVTDGVVTGLLPARDRFVA
jgi:hypothetical protein